MSNNDIMEELRNITDFIVINYTEMNNKEKEYCEQIFVRIEPIPENKFLDVYKNLSKLYGLWGRKNKYGMPFITYMAYGYDDVYHECLYYLSNYPELWDIPEEQNNYTALHLFLQSIIAHGKKGCDDIITNLLMKDKLIWKTTSVSGETPLHMLCTSQQLNYDQINELLKCKELWIIPNKSGMTSLHYLCRSRDKNTAFDLIKLMMDDKYNELWMIKDDFGYTPLHFACRNFICQLQKEFLRETMEKRGSMFQIKNNSGLRPSDLV